MKVGSAGAGVRGHGTITSPLEMPPRGRRETSVFLRVLARAGGQQTGSEGTGEGSLLSFGLSGHTSLA